MRHIAVYPSADLERGLRCAYEWRAKGYDVVIGVDQLPSLGDDGQYLRPELRPFLFRQVPMPFPGYYRTINYLMHTAFGIGRDVLVTACADDMAPPMQGAEHVAEMYTSRFPDGFGILQGTGDPQGKDATGTPAAARICGSPTFGRGWYERAYGGGYNPFCDLYRSFYADEDLWNVAKKCGVLWLEPSIKIDHLHWSWKRMHRQPYHEVAQRNWNEDRALFFKRQAEGFPGWEPLPK